MAALKSAPELFQKLSEQFLFVMLSSVAQQFSSTLKKQKRISKGSPLSQAVPEYQFHVFVGTLFNENANTKMWSCWEDIVFENMRMGSWSQGEGLSH